VVIVLGAVGVHALATRVSASGTVVLAIGLALAATFPRPASGPVVLGACLALCLAAFALCLLRDRRRARSAADASDRSRRSVLALTGPHARTDHPVRRHLS
jgi:protein-S-isoprenylcysteine O-methyltransferase Ste14